MNDWLKPNQEEKIIKNCVESIMEDLDDYYFGELIMKQYQKRLIEFFKKISKEYSLFKAGFDFSNKKNIVNDKEKLEEIAQYIAAATDSRGLISSWTHFLDPNQKNLRRMT